MIIVFYRETCGSLYSICEVAAAKELSYHRVPGIPTKLLLVLGNGKKVVTNEKERLIGRRKAKLSI